MSNKAHCYTLATKNPMITIAGKSILLSCIYSLYMINYVFVSAGVSELADEADSKSVFRKEVWVQVPSPA